MMNHCEEMETMKGRRYGVTRKKTRLEKSLIILCVILLLILAAMAIFIAIALYSNLFKARSEPKAEIKVEPTQEAKVQLKPDSTCNYTTPCINEGDSKLSEIKEVEQPWNICNSLPCIQEAAAIIRKIDFSVPPCKDFYRFACGSYMKDGIPDTMDYTRDVTSDMEREVNLRIRRILEGMNHTRRSENEVKMKKFYTSCLDMRKKDLSTREIIQNIIRQLRLEEWPPVQRNTASMTLEEKLAIIMAHGGKNPLFRVEYEGMNTVMLQESETILQEEYLLSEVDDNQALDEYRRLMIEVFTRAGFSNSAAESEVESVLEFETSIAEIARDHLDDAYSLLDIAQLGIVLPKFSWLPLFRHLYHNVGRVGNKAKDVNVVLQSPGYLEELIQLLQDTNPRTVESYVMWSFMFQFLHIFDLSLAKHYHQLNTFVNQNINGIVTTDWESCVLLTKARFQHPLNYHYAKEVLKENIVEKVEEIERDVKHSFKKLMQSEKWKQLYNNKAWKEVDKISLIIPYKNIHASKKPQKLYPHMRIFDDFIANVFHIEKEIVSDLIITGSPQELQSTEEILAIRPLYESLSYGVPLGIFQSPYIGEGMPGYSSYAALGFPLGAKLSRFLQEFQSQNEMKPTESKNSTSSEETNCFETEYLEFFTRMRIEKMNTSDFLSEYLNSNIGVRLAFEAYKTYVNTNGGEEKLPGLDFEPDQLFFISHAGLMCEIWTEETEEKYFQTGRSPAEFRVNSALRHYEEFAKAFSCPAGSNMNSNTKCLV